MDIENLEAANKAVKRLKEVQIGLDIVISERARITQPDANCYLSVKIDNHPIFLSDYPDLQNEILESLFSRYSKEKQELIEQIKSF